MLEDQTGAPRPPRGFVLTWSYRPRPGAEAEFSREYGPEGSWGRLFRRSAGYLGTEILRPTEPGGTYLVIDRWEDAASHRRFLERFAADYGTLGERLSALWTEEQRLGAYELGGPATANDTDGSHPPRAAEAGEGEADLQTLLATMRPRLDDTPYVFVTQPRVDGAALEAALASFREDEGVTLVIQSDLASTLGFDASPPWARITLTVHSSLDAVGLIGRVATALAVSGISCNPVSAWYHDHLFVPWDERERALATLQSLSAS